MGAGAVTVEEPSTTSKCPVAVHIHLRYSTDSYSISVQAEQGL